MKRIFVFLSLVMFGMPLYASTMCVANDMVAIVLDPSINGTNYSSDRANMLWTTMFDYGNLSGDALCSTTPGSYAKVGTPNESGGGEYCWCRMQHPVASVWVRVTADACETSCAFYCSFNVQQYAEVRAGLFGSVAQ